MSKLTNEVLRGSAIPITEKQAEGLAVTVNAGTVSRASFEASDNVKQAIASMNYIYIDFDAKLQKMVVKEVELAERTKVMTQAIKNYVGQITDGMARMDKIVGVDFEKRLELLERFVLASQALAELEKTQRLQKIATALR